MPQHVMMQNRRQRTEYRSTLGATSTELASGLNEGPHSESFRGAIVQVELPSHILGRMRSIVRLRSNWLSLPHSHQSLCAECGRSVIVSEWPVAH